MGLTRKIYETKNGGIGLETSTFKGRKSLVVRRGWFNGEDWTYKREGINFNKSSFEWLISILSENLKDITDFFESKNTAQLNLPDVNASVLAGRCYEISHENARVEVTVDSRRNPQLIDADLNTLAQTLRCVDNALHDYFDASDDLEIEKIHAFISSQLRSARWSN